MFRTIGAAAAVAAVLALAACSDSADEPTGLTGDTTSAPETTDSPAPSETPEVSEPESSGTGGTATPAPSDTFTQPYLPEERTVELREMIPVLPPEGASQAELDVLDAAGAARASWEQILWGVPFDETNASETSTGEHLDTVREYAEESVDLRRVTVGPPQNIAALKVSVDGSTATADLCFDMNQWTDIFEDRPPEPNKWLSYGTATFESVDGRWLQSDVDYHDDASPCEGKFS